MREDREDTALWFNIRQKYILKKILYYYDAPNFEYFIKQYKN